MISIYFIRQSFFKPESK